MTRVGERRLCGEYEITAGRRGVFAQRIDGRIAVSDAPLEGDGRVYLIDRHVESQAELDGLCSAYIEHSTQANIPGVLASRQRLDDLADTPR